MSEPICLKGYVDPDFPNPHDPNDAKIIKYGLIISSSIFFYTYSSAENS